jgi:hypothetical protein
MTRLMIGLALFLCVCRGAGAQVADTCSYETCALRIVEDKVLAGADGREIARPGLFSPPRLRPLLEVSDSASFYIEVLENNYTSGQVMSLLGLIAVSIPYLMQRESFEGPPAAIAVGLSLGGAAAVIIGGIRSRRARTALANAIWWYNLALTRTGGEREQWVGANRVELCLTRD